MRWRVEILNQTVLEELDALPSDMRAKLDHIVRLVEEIGLHQVRAPYVKPLRDKHLGDACHWSRRDRPRHLRDRDGSPYRHPARVSQEEPEDATGGDSHRLDPKARIGTMTIPYTELRKRWKKDPEFRKEFEALRPEFKLARDLIEARIKAGLSQSEVAARMGTSQPTVARLESGHKPSLKSLERYAEAVGMKLEINLVND